MTELLSIENLRAGYGEAVVLPDMTLHLREGEVLALLGRNGTGKTTLINSIVGVTRRFAGKIALAGRDVTPMRPAGAQYFPLADGGREHDGGGAAGAVDGGENLRDVSAPAGAAL